MAIFSKEFRVKSTESTQVINITGNISRILLESGIKEGFLIVYSPHTTTAIYINENESGLIRDI